MMSGLLSSKKFWIVLGIVVLVVIGLAIFLASKNDEVAITHTETLTPSQSDANINFSEYGSSFSEEDRRLIAESLGRQLGKEGQDLKGVVRSGSYSESVVDNTPVKQMLIDVASLKKTFLVYKTSGGSGGQNILYVRCAPQESQLEPSWECIDETE